METTMASEVVVYVPQRRLHAALSSARRPHDEKTMTLFLRGFSPAPMTFCVVDITGDATRTASGLAIVGTCCVSRLGEGEGSGRSAPSKRAASTESQLVVECGNPDVLRHADALDRSLRGVSVGSRDSGKGTQFHFVLYDPHVLEKWNIQVAEANASPQHEILSQLRGYHGSSVRATSSTASAISTVIRLPFSVALAVWSPLARALDAPVLNWLPIGNGSSLQSYSQAVTFLSYRMTSLLSLPLQVREEGSLSLIQVADFVVYLLVDYLLGLLFSSFFAATVVPAAVDMDLSPFSFLDAVRVNVIWLMDAPAGFKLNVRLAAILGNGILMWLDFWAFLFKSVMASGVWQSAIASMHLHAAVSLVWRHTGLTLQLSVIADLVWLVTWNSYYICLYFTKLNAMQLRLLSSLWKLFLGKKHNVLRKRVDSCEYDLNQLLLGTLLFTITVFLVTTNAVFFIFFSLVRLGVWVCQTVIWLPIIFLRGVPLASMCHQLLVPRAYTTTLGIQALDCRVTSSSLIIPDVSPGRSRSRDHDDRDAFRDFINRTQCEATTNSSSLLFEVVPRASSVGQLYIQLQAYLTELKRSYNGSAIVKSCLFGSAIPGVDAAILFPLPRQSTSQSPTLNANTKSKVE